MTRMSFIGFSLCRELLVDQLVCDEGMFKSRGRETQDMRVTIALVRHIHDDHESSTRKYHEYPKQE